MLVQWRRKGIVRRHFGRGGVRRLSERAAADEGAHANSSGGGGRDQEQCVRGRWTGRGGHGGIAVQVRTTWSPPQPPTRPAHSPISQRHPLPEPQTHCQGDQHCVRRIFNAFLFLSFPEKPPPARRRSAVAPRFLNFLTDICSQNCDHLTKNGGTNAFCLVSLPRMGDQMHFAWCPYQE